MAVFGSAARFSNKALWLRNMQAEKEATQLLPIFPHHKRSLTPEQSEILPLCIGGTSYKLRYRSIRKHGFETLLGKMIRKQPAVMAMMADEYLPDTGEYFFERSPFYFDPIYVYLSTGRLHIPPGTCIHRMFKELKYWRIPRDLLDSCCSPFCRETVHPMDAVNMNVEEPDVFKDLIFGNTRRRIWSITEGLQSGKLWKMYEFVSCSFVIISIVTLILGSIPELQTNAVGKSPKIEPNSGNDLFEVQVEKVTQATYTIPPKDYSCCIVPENTEFTNTIERAAPALFKYLEYICVGYFTIDYFFRFLISPDKKRFVILPINIVDLVAIAPVFFEFLFSFISVDQTDSVNRMQWAFLTVRMLRIVRVFRIAKLGRFSTGLQSFAKTIKRSQKQLHMVWIIFCTAVIFFSTMVYNLEKYEPGTSFTSIPAAVWWCVVTMTTVGYGDVVPVTIPGKLVAAGAIICGVLTLALPITVIVNNFMQVAHLRPEAFPYQGKKRESDRHVDS